MKRLLLVSVPYVLATLLWSPAAKAQNCSSPPTGFGGSWWREYAAWCTACGGTPDVNTTSCTPGPNWGGRGGGGPGASSPSAPPPSASPPPPSQPLYDGEADRQRQEAERKRAEDERLRHQAEARRKQEEFESNKQEALRNMRGLSGGLGLKGFDTGENLGLKGPGSSKSSAWDAQITNPQIMKIAQGLDAIKVPPPIPGKEASLSWKQLYLNNKAMLNASDYVLDTWELAGTLGEGGSLTCKVILIGGKTFIAGEEGAYVHLVKQDKVYEDALRYLKDSAKSKQFVALVRALKEKGTIPESADPEMLKAARAILDPKLGSSGAQIAWDAMLSPEARAAMVRKASMEVGVELVSSGTQGLLYDLTKRKEVYQAARLEREEARKMLKHTADPLDKDQLRKVVSHANEVLDDLYRLQKVVPTVAARSVGDSTGELAAIYFGDEKKGTRETPGPGDK